MDDYRRTKYCPELDNVRKKKEHIKNKIKEEHPDYTEEQIAMKMIHDSGCPISRCSADSFNERICS